MDPIIQLKDPENYFTGVGKRQFPIPTNILLFLREKKCTLQREAAKTRSHHRIVIIFNFATEGHIHLNHLVLPFKPGQALCILPHQFHHYSHLAAPDLKWLFCTFELDPITSLHPLRNRIIIMGKETKKSISEVLKKWHLCHSELQIEQLQISLLLLLRSLQQEQQAVPDEISLKPNKNLLNNINRQLAEWRGRPVTANDLAKALDLSKSHLRELFKKDAGIPLGSHLRHYRIYCAIYLLQNTNLTIGEIATETGYATPQAFSRFFKKETKQSPRDFRKTQFKPH